MTFAVGQGAVVVDASVAIELLQGDGGWLDRWAAWIATHTLVLAPAHFPYEVANGLVLGLQLAPDRAIERLERLYRAGFETADRGLDGLRSTVGLAHRHHLTIYDAAYLDLALDVEGELATLDKAMRAAAVAEGVSVVG